MIVVEGGGSVDSDRWLLRLSRPAEGVIAVAARPNSHAFWSLASEILAVVGQRELPQGATDHDRRLLRIWLQAHVVRSVIVVHAEHYATEVLHRLDDVLVEVDARLWIVVEPVAADAIANDLSADGVDFGRRTWSQFRSAWDDHASSRRATAPVSSPVLDATSLWERENARLARVAGRRIDLPYLGGFYGIASGGDGQPRTKLAVSARLRNALSNYTDPLCIAQAARGAKVALRAIGWEVDLHVRRLAGHAIGRPLARPADVATLDDLRMFREPLTGATAVLLHLDLAPAEIIDLRLDDLSLDGRSLKLWHDSVDVPGVAAPILLAQRIARRYEGASGDARLLTEGQRPLSARRLQTIGLAAREEVGRGVGWEVVRDRPAEDERWLLERGVALRWLSRTARSQRDRLEARQLLVDVADAQYPLEDGAHSGCSCRGAHPQPDVRSVVFAEPPTHAAPSRDHPWSRPGAQARVAERRD